MRGWLNDIRFAGRALRKSPGFTVIALLTLGLGIGANTAIFSVVNGTLLHPLPYPHAEQLVMYWEHNTSFGSMSISYPNYLDWRSQTKAFRSMAVYRSDRFNLTGRGEPEQVRGRMVSANIFRTLGVMPLVGRDFRPEEDRLGGEPVAILAEGYWQQRFGGDPGMVGKQLTLNGKSYTVVGVVPDQYRLLTNTDLYVPIGQFAEGSPFQRGNHPGIYGIARLVPGVTLVQAQQDMDGIARTLSEQYAENQNDTVELHAATQYLVAGVKPALYLLSGAVMLVLLIACVNVANLLLGRATLREREMALRASLGAGRWRLIRQLLTESVLLAALGGTLGITLASWGVTGLKAVVGGLLPEPDAVTINWTALAFTLVVSVLTGVLFGLLPAFQLVRRDLAARLRSGTRAGQARESRRAQGGLAIAEIALAIMLLVGAGLLTRSFLRVLAVDPGFDSHNVLTMSIRLPADRYQDDAARRQFWDAVIDRVAALPGVTHVGITNNLPLVGGNETSFAVVGQPKPEPGHVPFAEYAQVSPDYFATLGMHLQRGRLLNATDGPDAPMVVVIDKKLADTFWPGQDPLGQQIELGGRLRFTVIGVVATILHDGLDVQPAYPQVYFSAQQGPDAQNSLVVRAATDPLSLVGPIRRAVLEVDPSQPVSDVRRLQAIMDASLSTRRASMTLIAIFAALATLLALVGLYGVISYGVSRRTQELGVRMALGASSRQILGMVLRETGLLTLGGTLLGLLGALLVVRWLRSQLFQLSAYDPFTFLGVAGLIVLATLAAALLPARRATRIQPTEALREG